MMAGAQEYSGPPPGSSGNWKYFEQNSFDNPQYFSFGGWLLPRTANFQSAVRSVPTPFVRDVLYLYQDLQTLEHNEDVNSAYYYQQPDRSSEDRSDSEEEGSSTISSSGSAVARKGGGEL